MVSEEAEWQRIAQIVDEIREARDALIERRRQGNGCPSMDERRVWYTGMQY